jgi:hypothetical protein
MGKYVALKNGVMGVTLYHCSQLAFSRYVAVPLARRSKLLGEWCCLRQRDGTACSLHGVGQGNLETDPSVPQ